MNALTLELSSTADCAAGYEFDPLVTVGDGCVPCKRGYYRDKTDGAYCSMCPFDKVTEEEASISIKNCSMGK